VEHYINMHSDTVDKPKQFMVGPLRSEYYS